MQELNIKVKTYTTDPPVFDREGVLCLFYLEMESENEGTVCVHESFWKGLEKETKEDQETIKKQLMEYLTDQKNYNENREHPLKNNSEAYKAYCELRYSKLNKLHNNLLSKVISSLFSNLLADSGKITKILNDQNLNDFQKEEIIKAIKEKLADPGGLNKLLNNM